MPRPPPAAPRQPFTDAAGGFPRGKPLATARAGPRRSRARASRGLPPRRDRGSRGRRALPRRAVPSPSRGCSGRRCCRSSAWGWSPPARRRRGAGSGWRGRRRYPRRPSPTSIKPWKTDRPPPCDGALVVRPAGRARARRWCSRMPTSASWPLPIVEAFEPDFGPAPFERAVHPRHREPGAELDLEPVQGAALGEDSTSHRWKNRDSGPRTWLSKSRRAAPAPRPMSARELHRTLEPGSPLVRAITVALAPSPRRMAICGAAYRPAPPRRTRSTKGSSTRRPGGR